MGQKTGIEWTDATWSPLRARVKAGAAEIARAKGYTSLVEIAVKMAGHVGPHCEHVSPGCENCYAETNNHRCLPANGTGLPFDRRSRDLVETFVDEKILREPVRWREARRIFVENQADLFGAWVTDEMIDRVFAVMATCRKHTFQVLTKRPERARAYLSRFTRNREGFVTPWGSDYCEVGVVMDPARWPLPNVWLGVSAENQGTADERIPMLLATPATLRFVSYEPALGPLDLSAHSIPALWHGGLHWVIAGGESGPGARPAHPQWFRDVRDRCQAAGVPFFFKQWGEHHPLTRTDGIHESPFGGQSMLRIGKKKAGHLLDGVEWHQFPASRP